MARHLLEPILDNGVSNPHYFEGRLLTAAALREDQDAHRARQRQLGRAIGRGVVSGLWVTVQSPGSSTTPPLLQIGAGLAINANGQTLELPGHEIVALARSTQALPDTTGLFKTCEPPATQVEGLGEGFYVLVISPASAFKGRAPASGLTDPMAGAGCGSKWAVEGVRFRMLPLDPLNVTGLSAVTKQLLQTQLLLQTTEAATSRLRNVVAHLCLGTEQLVGFATEPFAREPLTGGGTEAALADYGAVDDLIDAGTMSDCDVPLALLHWRLNGGLVFADNWAVRRRTAAPPAAAPWPTLSGGRRHSEAEAAFFQFQEHLGELVARAANPSLIRARTYFRWLPSAGLLPLPGGGRIRGIDGIGFFNDMTARLPVFMEGARFQALLASSFAYPPVDVETGEMFWRYQLRENRLNPATTPPVLIFTSGHVPFLGEAQFDLAHWNFSNFGSLVLG